MWRLLLLLLTLFGISACKHASQPAGTPSYPMTANNSAISQKQDVPNMQQARQELLKRELIRRIVFISKKNERCGDRSALVWPALVQTEVFTEYITLPQLAKLYRELKEEQAKICQ